MVAFVLMASLEFGLTWAIVLDRIELEHLSLTATRARLVRPSRVTIELPVRFIRLLGTPATLDETHSATTAFPARPERVVGPAPIIPLPLTEVSLMATIPLTPKFVVLRTFPVLLRAPLDMLGMSIVRGLAENYMEMAEFPVIPPLFPGPRPATAFPGRSDAELLWVLSPRLRVPSRLLICVRETPDALAKLGMDIRLVAPPRLPNVKKTLTMVSKIMTSLTMEVTTTRPPPCLRVVPVCRLVWAPALILLPGPGMVLNRLAIGPNVRAGVLAVGVTGMAVVLTLVRPWVPTPARLANGPNVVVTGILLPTNASRLPPNLEVAVHWPR